MDAYITITAHSISDDLCPINVLLDTHHVPERHTGDNIADALENTVQKWKVSGKVFAVVTDNASTMKKAVNRMIRKGICSIHINCFAHMLQLCIEDGLKS